MLQAERYKNINAGVSEYIINEVLPLLEKYIDCLRNAGYPPSYFFDKKFTVDTGTICNLGKAIYEFRGLVSKENVPLTPQQERAFGTLSSLSQDKKVWRVSPVPFIQTYTDATLNTIGKYNSTSKKQLLSIQEIDLSQKSSPKMYITRQFYVELPPNSIDTLQLSTKIPYIPGSVPIELASHLNISASNKSMNQIG